VLADARSRGATTLGITNEPNSTMAEISEYTLLARAGTEESVAATKTYTCQLLALYLVAYALGGEVSFDALRQLPQCVEDVLEIEDRVGEIAERYMYMTRAVTVGRGLNYANALEFGLKLMETCYVVTERLSSADLMHGPIALVEHAFPVFVFAPSGVTWQSISAVVDMLEDVKAETLVITDESNSEACAKPARLIRLPHPTGSLGWPAGFVHAHSVHRAGAIVRRAIGGDQGVEPGSAEDAAQDHPDDVGPAVSEPRPEGAVILGSVAAATACPRRFSFSLGI